MTFSQFRAALCQGHLDRVPLKRIYGYLSKMHHGIIPICTELPGYSVIPKKTYDWDYTCYEGAEELIPDDMPRLRGKEVHTTTFVDANLYHDLISGRLVTGILHNKTPINWFSKPQSTVKTATFRRKYVAARTATEQVIDLCNTLRYRGVLVREVSMMFNNQTVVNTASVPRVRLQKQHVALSYHKVCEAVAVGIMRFHHVCGKLNPADILSKHWDYTFIWNVLKPLMFLKGNTKEFVLPLPEEEIVTKQGTAAPMENAVSGEENPPG
jgi:hypothetical protein